MKISVEEVSRVLAFSTHDRPASSLSVSTVPRSGFQSREAAQVDVSNAAQDILKIKKQISRLPDVREDRVQALKAQIENGTYHVSGEDIAELMIRRTLADNTVL